MVHVTLASTTTPPPDSMHSTANPPSGDAEDAEKTKSKAAIDIDKNLHGAQSANHLLSVVPSTGVSQSLVEKGLISLTNEEATSLTHASADSSRSTQVNSDARHSTWNEVSEQLDGVLRALGQMRQLQQRSRHVSRLELTNLRVAYRYAITERDCVLKSSNATVSNNSSHHSHNVNINNDNQSPNSTSDKGKNNDSGSKGSKNNSSHKKIAAQGGSVYKHVPTPSTGASIYRNNYSNDNNDRVSSLDSAAASLSENTSTSSAQSSTGPIPAAMVSAVNEKAAAAERMLGELEAYVEGNPNSSTFESTDHAKFISWRSIIHTPSERRLQSLIVSIFMFFTAIPICICVTGLLLYCRYTAPFMILYLVYTYTIGRVRHPCRRDIDFAHWRMWQYYADYFPVRLVLPRHARRRFNPKRNYLFIYHPHGVHSFGAICNFLVDTRDLWGQLPGIVTHIQTLRVNFYVPLWRSMLIRLGCGDASADCIRKTLRSGPGESVVLVVGGTEEALLTRPHTNNIVLNKRKGFIRIALQEGSPLVPIYGFGENDAFNIIDVEKKSFLRRVLKTSKRVLGFSLPLISGRGFFIQRFGILPYRHPIVVVISEPLEVPKIESPTHEEIDLWHDRYVARLRDLYNKHCSVYDLESTGLRITN